jgi:antitoxin CptB
MSTLKKKLLYRSNHRGCKETDDLLGEFANKVLDSLSPIEIQEYEKIVAADDADLYNWICGKEVLPTHLDASLMQKIINFNQTRKRG